jgi:chaperonin GroES
MKVLFSSYAGNEVTVDGKDYIIMREEDVLATVS